MITITRRQARRLRAVFRRHALGITHKGLVPPLVFRADPAAGLRVRHHQAPLAVECLLPGADRAGEVIALPLDSLADVEGKDETSVALEAAASNRTVVRWDDRGIPQSREYPVPEASSLPPFPDPPPAAFEACPAGLLDALAEAALTTDEGSTRYALGCIQVKGDTGELVATDGRQILIQGGFRFPWKGDLLVPRSPLFASRGLPRDRPVGVGRTDGHVAIRVGAWTVWLPVRDGRFPRIEHAIPDASSVATRLRIDPEDAAFLGHALGRLPGADEANSPATLDLNGRVAFRARGVDQARVTELILSRSDYTGAPVRVNANRAFLARAVRLGFAEAGFVDADSPVVCRDARRTFCFQPLSKGSAIEPTDDVTRVESTAPSLRPIARSVVKHQGESPVSDENTPARPSSMSDGRPDGPAPAVEGPGPGGLAALIQEAEALHEALTDARARSGRLIVTLRRYRRRERLVSTTLASLKALKLQDVAG